MMIADCINLKRMPSGRHAFALALVEARARDVQLTELVDTVAAARDVARETLAMELQWSQVLKARKSRARGDSFAMNTEIDKQIVAIFKGLDSDKVGDAGDPVVEAAKKVLSFIFPNGPGAITLQTYEEQLGSMDAMLAVFDTKLALEVQTLHLERKLNRLRRMVEKFRRELGAKAGSKLTYKQLKAQRKQLHEATCQAMVAALHLAADAAERAELLEPIVDQQRRVSEARSRQRAVADVDPDTGEELPAEDAPQVINAPQLTAELIEP